MYVFEHFWASNPLSLNTLLPFVTRPGKRTSPVYRLVLAYFLFYKLWLAVVPSEEPGFAVCNVTIWVFLFFPFGSLDLYFSRLNPVVLLWSWVELVQVEMPVRAWNKFLDAFLPRMEGCALVPPRSSSPAACSAAVGCRLRYLPWVRGDVLLISVLRWG